MGFYPNFCFWYFVVGVQTCLWFLNIDFVSCCFAKFICILSRFFVESIGFSMCSIMSSTNNNSFVYSFPIWMSFISFSYLIALARTSNTMMNTSGENGHPCLVLDLNGKDLVFAHWVWCWLQVSHIWPLLGWEMLPPFPLCWVFLSQMDAVPYQILFFTSIDMIMWFLSFLCDVLCLLFCKYCTILASLWWIPFDHGVWSF